MLSFQSIKDYIVSTFALLFMLLVNNIAFAVEKENIFPSQNCSKTELIKEVSEFSLGNAISENDFSNQKSYIRLSGVECGEKVARVAAEGVMNPNEIHFMQSSIKNATGEFTVLGNSEALANGTLNPNVLRMNVWKDATGKVWTLDHRRLAAFRLSGLQEAPIQWANPAGQMWKMTTTNGGTAIKLKLGGGNSMIIH